MDKFDVSYQNYDVVVKNAFSIFNNRTLDFLGLNLPPIKHLLNVELPEITAKESKVDLIFLLMDDSILHLESEIHLSLQDLIRFAGYDLNIFNTYKVPIHTVVLSLGKKKPSVTSFNSGSLSYSVRVHNIAEIDGEEVLAKLKVKINDGEEINPLELIFLPLMKQRRPVETILMEVINLEKIVELDKESKEKLIASSLVIVDKLVDRKVLEEMWEALTMYKIFEIAEEKGMQKGIQKGIERGMSRGLEQGKKDLLCKLLITKFKKLPRSYEEKIQQLSAASLEMLSINIFDMTSIKDLDEYI